MANTKVTTGVIKDDAVGADQLASNAVVTASITDNAVTTAKISDDAILTAKISNSAITNAKMSANSVDSDQYVDASIDTAHIRDGQITSAKLDTNISISGELTVGSHLNMGDSDILKMGASADLQIYHDGSNSYVKDAGTGNLNLQGENLALENTSGDNYFVGVNGSFAKIYYSGVEKLATTSSGVDVTGTAVTDGLTATGVIVTEGNAAVNDAQIGRLNFTNTNSNASSNPIRASILSGRQNSAWGGYLSLYTSTGTDAASEKVRIGETGNVGIGTTSPANKLDIVDSTAGFGARITNNNDSSQGLQVRTSDNDSSLYILDLQTSTSATGTNYSSQFVVEKDGKVGIGTDSPQTFLHIKTTSPTISMTDTNSFSDTNDRFQLRANADVGMFQWYDDSASSTTTLMTLTPSSTFGFGMSPLGTNNGSAFFDGNVSSKDGFMTTASDLQMIAPSAGNTIFVRDNGNESARITSSGTLLVSTTTASGLSNGTSNYGHSFGGGQQVNATNNDTNLILNMSNGSSNPHVQFRSDGGNTGSITTNGSAVAFNTGSDYRLKENVIPLKDGLDRLNKLNPVQFDWKKSQETDEGFIAHEVQEIVPYVVKGEKDGEKIQTMDYGKLTPLLVKAIQELSAEVEELKTKLDNK